MQVTLGRLVGGIFGLTVLLIAAFWAVATLSTSGLRDDVSAIRSTIGSLQGSDKDNALNIKQAEIDFTKQVSSLNVTLVAFTTKVDAFGAKIDTMSRSFDQLSEQMASVEKQLGSREGAAITPESIATALRKAGYDGKSPVVVIQGGR